MKYLFLVIYLVFQYGCDGNHHNSKAFKHIVTDEVNLAVKSFHAADTSKNAEAVINLLWPECTFIIDGNRHGYDSLCKASRDFMPTLKEFNSTWNDITIIPHSESLATSSFFFQDSIVSQNGQIYQSRGPNTFVWEKRNGYWKVIYGHVEHYPLP